jgi:hypothetical protein
MSYAIQGLLFGWKKNLDYGPRLVADLSEDQMIAQPATNPELPANHPAWVFSHLNVYVPVVSAIIAGEAFADPKDHRFGMQSKPEQDRSFYPSKTELINEFVAGHEKVVRQLETADDSILANEIQLERWKSIMPNAGIALPYLMLNHENNHLGQLSAWRRIQGLPSV